MNIEIENKNVIQIVENQKALLIGVYEFSNKKEECLENLSELKNLSLTFGLDPVEIMPVHLRQVEPSTFIGSGKVDEIKLKIEELSIEVIVFDFEIAPHQQRNLEKAFKITVIDRTELILAVFAHHAKTKEAKLQIKLAEYKYELPRLKRMWTHLSRQRTGGKSGGFLKGEGEKQIEIDKKILKSKISELSKQIDDIKKHREVLRKQRQRTKIPIFAIIGYTNAGKSSLLNSLTDSKVLVEDKLFATLDTTTRKYFLPNGMEILLIDTVGFIRKLPHTVVAAFKSTLEEAVFADILIHIIDVSSPTALDQAKASLDVLKELNAIDKPIITCLNKIDKLTNSSVISLFKINFPKTVEISTVTRDGFPNLLSLMESEIEHMRKIVKLKIPQSSYNVVSEIIKEGKIINIDYEENDILLEVELPKILLSRVAQFIC